ncbi:kinase-like domain-containing protein [Lentinula raphanica]|nr:kinase-like domain-containing protein [Lentinula raphanica]
MPPVTQFLDRKGHITMLSLTSNAQTLRKRRGTNSIFVSHAGVERTNDFVSTFVRTPRAASETITTSEVTLTRARIVCDPKTGEVDVSWPGENDGRKEVTASIGDVVFGAGKTKNVYKLVMDNELYVAKWFMNCGNGIDAVTADENEEFLISDITRLKSTQWLLRQFKDAVVVKSIDIAQNIAITECWLFKEKNFTPSKASGLAENVPKDTTEFSAVWLVEPRRTKAVEKYSSTLIHPPRGDKIGITLSAFTHYVLWSSQNKLVIADVQGSLANIGGIDTVILFDIMTHTKEQDSGVGDFGQEGIDSFCNQHICNYICEGLGLERLNNIVEDED